MFRRFAGPGPPTSLEKNTCHAVRHGIINFHQTQAEKLEITSVSLSFRVWFKLCGRWGPRTFSILIFEKITIFE